MISCHELRTGNIILVNNRLRKVMMISNSQSLTDRSMVGVESIDDAENENYTAEEIEPVPMSEAILQQCHFTYHPYFKFWQLIDAEGKRTEMDIDGDYSLIDFMRRPIVKKLTSLHQLQNIYYSLLGKDLDFDADTAVVANGIIRSAMTRN